MALKQAKGRHPKAPPLPAGVVIQLPVGGLVLLPPQRGAGGSAEW